MLTLSRTLVLSLLVADGAAQMAWIQRNPANSPTPRQTHAMAYDEARHRTVLFGGFDGSNPLADTWEWDGTTWTQHFPRSSPPARELHVMAYCPARSRVVLFGGLGWAGLFGDTWEWDGNDWQQVATPIAPPPRIMSAMAQDPRGSVVLFSGQGRSDTWEYNGQWVQRTPATSPPARRRHGMAFDARRNRTIVYGGDRNNALYGDLWEWDGNTWTERELANRPPLRGSWSSMTYDGLRDRIVLYVWLWSSSEVWEWDGNTWVERSTAIAPPPRYPAPMVYDWLRSRVVLFGGQGWSTGNANDTWEYFTPSPAGYTPFGTGCAGSAGTTPRLDATNAFEQPWTGSSFSVEVANLPPGNATAMALGASNTQWGNATLPFDLTGLGMPGCRLYTSTEVFAPLANPTGTANLTLAIPANPALVGGAFYNQAFVVDPPANALGVTVSNAAAGTMGAR